MPSSRRFSDEYAMRCEIACRGVRSRRDLAADLEFALVGAVDAAEQSRELGAPRAEQPGEAHDLAGRDGQVGRIDRAAATEALGVHEDRGIRFVDDHRAGALLEVVEDGELLADHLLHEVDAQQLLDEVLPHELAVAQHGEAVADLVHLVEEVRDEEDRDALLLQRADDAEELGDLVGVEARGGLVEDEHLRLHVDRSGDRNELLHRERVVAEERPRVEVEVEAREQFGGAAAHRPPVDRAEAARLAAEHDVLGHRQVRQEVDLLVHRRDARCLRLGGAAERHLLAREGDGAGVDAVDARERLDERGLARAVLAHERVHLAGEHAEVDAVERLHAGEGDRDALHLDDRRGDGCLGHESLHRGCGGIRSVRCRGSRVGHGGCAAWTPAHPPSRERADAAASARSELSTGGRAGPRSPAPGRTSSPR